MSALQFVQVRVRVGVKVTGSTRGVRIQQNMRRFRSVTPAHTRVTEISVRRHDVYDAQNDVKRSYFLYPVITRDLV